ncbi:hypothetical protein YSA_01904 [Pseudomonas putida ND6]|uniref:Uncharacterized protein n=1 Tax=Pseudomonas putida ND6 TaxID=231023 RepID=I3UQN3_PSEPU|nr:hypothetical protein YSA_01904 [Pseudomonas putida ND6]
MRAPRIFQAASFTAHQEPVAISFQHLNAMARDSVIRKGEYCVA